MKIAFLDPFVSAEEIGLGLKKYGLASVGIFQACHAQSPELKDRFKPHLFDELIFIEQNETLEFILGKIKALGVDYIFNGFDVSVPLADLLASYINPNTANNSKTSVCRFNKLSILDALSLAGFKVGRYLEVLNNTLSKEEEQDIAAHWNFPLILKPTNASGTHGFFECETLLALKTNLQKTISKHYGYSVDAYLLQEKLIGTEYVVDTFSWQGQHHLIHIRKYQKEYVNGVPIYRKSLVVLPTEPLHEKLKTYLYSVLDALELKNGFCHAEIFSTKDGFFVVDINPRLPGANNASCLVAKETYGYSHMDVFCHVLLDKQLNRHKYSFGQVLCLKSRSTDTIGEINQSKLVKFPSFKRCISNNKEGTIINFPQCLRDTVAFIVLANEDLQQLEADVEKIFVLEKNRMLF